MSASRGAVAGLLAGAVLALVAGKPGPKEPLPVRLDPAGPYLILSTRKAAAEYPTAIAAAKELHPNAGRHDFDPADLTGIERTLREKSPRYALVFIRPDELDVNFAWRWLAMAARLDGDPFPDVRTGFITGASPEAAAAFVGRIADAAAGRVRLPAGFTDNLGPPEQSFPLALPYFNAFPRSDFLPALADRCRVTSIMHSKGGFPDDKLDRLNGAGLLHFGGHGHPDRIDDGLRAAQVPKLKLAPCVVFNGTCYTGVTGRWFEPAAGGRWAERTVPAADSFCLNLLANHSVGYLAALHPDHGMPVYQEMEYLAFEGASLGDTMKRTYDGIVLGAGGKLPAFEVLKDGEAMPPWTPSDFMLKGTASRVLFGDPALIVGDAFAPPPFNVTAAEEPGGLRATATVSNAALKSTFTDTYHGDLNPKVPFNDRAWVRVDLPAGWKAGSVEAVGVQSGGKPIPYRLVGYAVEDDGGTRRLHAQVDVRADGFMQSPLRTAGAAVELLIRKAE